MASNPMLPMEIIEVVIDIIGYTSPTEPKFRSALSSCLLVSTFFRHLALTHLYERISINTFQKTLRDIRIQIFNLRQIVDHPPEVSRLPAVVQYVKTFHLDFVEPGSESMSDSDRSTLFRNMIFDENLVFLIRSMRRKDYGVAHFALRILVGKTLEYHGVNWTEFSPDFQAAFQYLVRSSYLQSLELRNVHCLPLTILRGSHLKSMTLSQSTRGKRTFVLATPRENLSYPKIQEFKVDPVSLLNENFYEGQYQLILQNVKRFEARFDGYIHSTNIWKLLTIARESIEHLRLIDPWNSVVLSDMPNLGLMPNLKTFRQSCCCRFYGQDETTTTITGLSRLLNIVRPMPQLSDLHFDFIYLSRSSFALDQDFFAPLKLHWDFIGTTLSSPLYPALSHVHIEISLDGIKNPLTSTDLDTDTFERTMSHMLQGSFSSLPKNVELNLRVTARRS